jgi:4-nitrophenyl phosphatase
VSEVRLFRTIWLLTVSSGFFFKVSMEPLSNVRALIIDMDGVLWHGPQPLPGFADLFRTLREMNLRFILATNNSSLTVDQYVAKLAQLGARVTKDEILTSGVASAWFMAERSSPPATRVFVIGEDGVRQPLAERGFVLTDLYEVPTQYVVVGMDRGLSWDKLATASLNIRAGATFIGTNPDLTFPTERGIIHGNGAVLAALQAATEVAPIIVGKPEPLMYRQAIKLLDCDPAETVAIGDRVETDILGAVRANIRSIMLLSGVCTEKDLEGLDYRPTWVMPDIRAVVEALRNGG